MRYLMLHKADERTESGAPPSPEVLEGAGLILDEMARSGVLLVGEGLQPSSSGARVIYSGGKHTVTDGPFAEAKELIAGLSIIQVESLAEAVAWASRFAEVDPDREVELLRISDPEDAPGAE